MMKIVAQFQFYFDFVIPRGPDWPSSFIRMHFPHRAKTVMLRARSVGEDLFPDEIDRTLAGMTLSLSRVSQPIGSLNVVVRDRCLDRVETQVEGDVASLPDVASSATQEAFEAVAIRATNSLLEHCRVLAQAPFVTGVERYYRLQDGLYYIVNPHTIAWRNGETGARIPVYDGEVNATASSGAIRSPERGQIAARALTDSLSTDELPSLDLSLLMDAEEHLTVLRLRECILSLASACEYASNVYIGRLAASTDRTVRAFLDGRSSFAEKRFHQVTTHLSGRSLRTEDPASFRLLESLYRERNDVIHGRMDPRRGPRLGLEPSDLHQRLEASRAAIEWLGRLAP